MEARSPTSLLSLPDDLLDLIVLGTLKDSCVVRHDRYCSGLAGTCRRLWGLHQYPTSRISDTCHEQRPKMVEGERQQLMPRVCRHIMLLLRGFS